MSSERRFRCGVRSVKMRPSLLRRPLEEKELRQKKVITLEGGALQSPGDEVARRTTVHQIQPYNHMDALQRDVVQHGSTHVVGRGGVDGSSVNAIRKDGDGDCASPVTDFVA
jgi:hypothetical protein